LEVWTFKDTTCKETNDTLGICNYPEAGNKCALKLVKLICWQPSKSRVLGRCAAAKSGPKDSWAGKFSLRFGKCFALPFAIIEYKVAIRNKAKLM